MSLIYKALDWLFGFSLSIMSAVVFFATILIGVGFFLTGVIGCLLLMFNLIDMATQ